MASIIDILIRAAWQGSGATQQAKKDLKGLSGESEVTVKSLRSLAGQAVAVTAAIGAIAVEAKLVYTELQRGAGLELTRQRFDRLAESIGTTGDALREDLGIATKGLLSNAEQMALVTDLIGLELANTESQAVRLARVVTELDQDVGELSLALVNQTTRRFDQLNVSAVGFEERLKALKEQGLDTQDAFTEAFLQQAEAQIERVGGVAGTSAGDMQAFEASIRSMRDEVSLALVEIVALAGGFEDLEEATQFINSLTSEIHDAREELERFIIGAKVLNALLKSDGEAAAAAFIELQQLIKDQALEDAIGSGANRFGEELEELNRQSRELSAEIEKTNIATEDFIKLLTTEHKIELFEQQIEDVKRFGEELEDLNRIAREGLVDTVGAAASREAANRQGVIDREQMTARAELFQDFQDDLTAINKEGAAEREAIEETYEARRNDIVADYGRARAEEEEQWQRSRARAEQRLRDDIDEVRESATESEIEAREDVNDRLVDLEKDHLRRMQEIIENANLNLEKAASRLDASAVFEIQSGRDAALEREKQSFNDQRQAIQDSLNEQLQNIRDNMQKRIDQLQEFHERRQKEEEEDRAYRLEKLEEAHRRELQELDDNRRQQLQDLKDSIRQQRREVTNRYREEYLALTQSWDDREDLQIARMAEILRLEEEWWNSRAAIVGSGPAGGRGGTGGTGTGGTGGTGGAGRPTRTELLEMFVDLAEQAGYLDNIIQGVLRAMQTWSDERIAKYIERVFDIDVPGYRLGTPFVPRTGLALVHQGERIIPADENRRSFNQRSTNININIYPTPGMDEMAVGKYVRRELADFVEAL